VSVSCSVEADFPRRSVAAASTFGVINAISRC